MGLKLMGHAYRVVGVPPVIELSNKCLHEIVYEGRFVSMSADSIFPTMRLNLRIF